MKSSAYKQRAARKVNSHPVYDFFFRLMRCFPESFLLLSLLLLSSSSSLCYVSAHCTGTCACVFARNMSTNSSKDKVSTQTPILLLTMFLFAFELAAFLCTLFFHTVWKTSACERKSVYVFIRCHCCWCVACILLFLS